MWAGIFFFPLSFIAIVVVQLLSGVTLCDPRGLQHNRFPYPSLSPSLFKLMSIESESESCSVMSDSLKPHGLYGLYYSPWNSPGQNTGVGSRSLFQEIFPTRIEPSSPTLQADSLPAEPPGKPKNTREGSLSLFQQIFPNQESNPGLLHCRWILYQLSY